MNESAFNLISTNLSNKSPEFPTAPQRRKRLEFCPRKVTSLLHWGCRMYRVGVKGHEAESFRCALAPAGEALDLFKKKKDRKGKLWGPRASLEKHGALNTRS